MCHYFLSHTLVFLSLDHLVSVFTQCLWQPANGALTIAKGRCTVKQGSFLFKQRTGSLLASRGHEELH
jgi:hypothetical protein